MGFERMRVAVGMSGGVDSTVAALLLLRAGHTVVGLTMQIWDGSVPLPDEGRSGCFGPGEAREAAQPHGAARGYSVTNSTTASAQQPLTVTHITAMMRSSAQTTPAGLGSPKMSRPMRPRTDAAFSWLHGFVRSMAGPCGAVERLAGS